MKNLVIILADNPAKPCGGLGERFKFLIPLLAQHFNVFTFCHKVTPADEELFGDGHRVYGFNPPRDGGGRLMPVAQAAFVHFVAVTLNSIAIFPDVVMCSDYATIMTAHTIAQFMRAKFVVEFDLAMFAYSELLNKGSNPFLSDAPMNDVAKQVKIEIDANEKFGAEQADLVITCSEYYKRVMPYTCKQLVAVPNGVCAADFRKPVAPFVFPGGQPNNFVFIGRLNTQKGIRQLLFAQLPPNSALHIVGGSSGGDCYEQVLAMVKDRASFPNLYHLGHLSGDAKVAVIRSASAIMFPSMHEPFGIVGLEAFAAQTPLITTRCGGIGDYADGTNSIICSSTPESISAAMHSLLRMSAEGVEELVSNGYSRALCYNWDTMGAIMTGALNRLF